MYAPGEGLSGIITDYSQVSDEGLAEAETFLTPAQLQQVLTIGSFPRYTGPDTKAQQDNLLQGQQPGGALWTLVHNAIGQYTNPKPGGITFGDAIRRYPQLTGLLVGYELFGITSGSPSDVQSWYATPDALMSLVEVRNSQQGGNVFQTSIALPDDVMIDEAQPYLDWVAHYLNALFAEKPAAIAGERDAIIYMVLAFGRQNAMARGITTLDMTMAGGNKIDVATELIHYMVELPDGTMYVVMDEITRDPANRYVYQWYGPNFKPQAFGPGGGATERMGVTTCVNITKGTGPWYTARVFGLIAAGSSCDATPDNFNGPWDLITKDIADALTYQSGGHVVIVEQPQQTTTTPSAGSGGPSVTVQPYNDPPPVLIKPTPPVVQTAPDLPVIPDNTPAPKPTTTPVVEVNLLPTNGGGPIAAAVPAAQPVLFGLTLEELGLGLVAVGVGVAVLKKSRRR